MLMKSYNGEETLSGCSPCRWYLNEDLPEIDSFFERFEDSGHLFFKCKQVKHIWRGLELEDERFGFAQKSNALDVFELLLGMNENIQALVANLLWNWWLERNKIRDGGAPRSVDDLVFIVRSQTNSFLDIVATGHTSRDVSVNRWQKPDRGWFKINTGGSFLADVSVGGWGAVLRDYNGCVLASGAGKLSNIMCASNAEALAVNRGVKLAIEKGCQRVILETDSVSLKSALASPVRDCSIDAMVIEETKLLLVSYFSDVRILCLSRSCNTVAHGLACVGRNLNLGAVLVVDGPHADVWRAILLRPLANANLHSQKKKYRLCLVGTDGTGTAEFVFFNRVAQQLVGKSVVPLLKSSSVPRETAAIVLHKYTLVVSVTEKNLTQRNISFQVNGIEAFLGKQTCEPNETRPAVGHAFELAEFTSCCRPLRCFCLQGSWLS